MLPEPDVANMTSGDVTAKQVLDDTGGVFQLNDVETVAIVGTPGRVICDGRRVLRRLKFQKHSGRTSVAVTSF